MTNDYSLLKNPATRGVVKRFVKNLPDRLNTIRSQALCENREGVRLAAHELKGTAANFGYFDIAEKAGFLESQALNLTREQLYTSVTDISYLSDRASLQADLFIIEP